MHTLYNELDYLVGDNNLLTVDDIYTTCLVISIPEDWVLAINGLPRNLSTDSTSIIEALKHQLTCCKACTEKDSNGVSVLKAKTTNFVAPAYETSNGHKICTFCWRHGHDLLVCNKSKQIFFKAHKEYGKFNLLLNQLKSLS